MTAIYDHRDVAGAMAPMRDDLIAARKRIEDLEKAIAEALEELDEAPSTPATDPFIVAAQRALRP